MLVLVLTISSLTVAANLEPAVADALVRANGNRDEIQAALDQCPTSERAGMEFLIRHMPTPDLQTLSAEFVREHVEYAYRAHRQSAWKNQVPDEVFLNYVLPYANINERRDAWRKDFYERFGPLVADAKTSGEAAAILNQKIFKLLDVKYSTKRPKADQSPYESIDAKLASCTGLSILLIDACRAVGIPARFVGTPLWSDRSGNHSWVEIWDNGWRFTGAAEPTGNQLDKGWFTDRASRAQADVPRHAIYAVSYAHTPLRFPLIWDRSIDYVRALNVTERYLTDETVIPDGHVQLLFRVTNSATRDRCAADFKIKDANGNVVYRGQSKDETFDANDHVAVPLPKDQTYSVEVQRGDSVSQVQVTANNDQQLVTIPVDDSGTANTQDEKPQEAITPRSSTDRSSDSTQRSSSSTTQATDPIAQLTNYLETKVDQRADLSTLDFAKTSLTRSQSQAAEETLWQDHVQRIRDTRAGEIKSRRITLGGYDLQFDYRVFGELPDGGRSLFISMHGGGNTQKRINDRQWENQKTLYEPKEGIYLSPRAPTDTWNLWHQDHIDPLFDRLIEDLIVLKQVNPNRVYLMGYSAGGDGVYQLAPRMADRFAAAAMMAGHPNETSPLGLRNLPFTLHMGERDGAYQRNQVAADWAKQLETLQSNDPDGYVHWVKIHAGKGHWMDKQDAAAVPWMASHTRQPLPEAIVWKQDDVTQTRFYWLAVDADNAKPGAIVRAKRTGQKIEIISHDVKRLIIYVNDKMFDLDQQIQLVVNGEARQPAKVQRTLGTIAKTLSERGDPESVFSGRIVVEF